MDKKILNNWIVGLPITMSVALSALVVAEEVKAQTTSIMAMGDSITQGVRGECGYRRALSQALLKNPQCDVTYVGSRSGAGDNSNAPTAVCAPQNTPHEATPGFRADQLLATVGARVTTFQPDVVLLHAGSNDLIQNKSVNDTVTDINAIIDGVFANQPNASVVLANVIPWSEESPDPIIFTPFENEDRDMLADTAQLATELATLVSTRVAAGDSIQIANVHQDFDNDLMTVDGVHPNPVGEAHIANKMIDALYNLGACGDQQLDVQPPITYINSPEKQNDVVFSNPTLSGTALDQGGTGINRIRIAIENSEGLWLDYASGTFSSGFDSTILATMTNTTTNSTDWSITTNLSPGNYRLYALAIDNAGNKVNEAAGNGQPNENEKVWSNRAFEVVAGEEVPDRGTDSDDKNEKYSWSEDDAEIDWHQL